MTRQIRTRLVILLCALAVTALTSESADWEPITLVLALGAVMTVADAPVVFTRRLRMSGGLMVQATAMALLGPAPAVAIGLASTRIESRLNRVSTARTYSNAIIVTVLGLVGGVLFDALGTRFGLDRDDGAYGAPRPACVRAPAGAQPAAHRRAASRPRAVRAPPGLRRDRAPGAAVRARQRARGDGRGPRLAAGRVRRDRRALRRPLPDRAAGGDAR